MTSGVTRDYCSKDTGYKCKNQTLEVCPNNGICELGEGAPGHTYCEVNNPKPKDEAGGWYAVGAEESRDCPTTCYDEDANTEDWYDFKLQKCAHKQCQTEYIPPSEEEVKYLTIEEQDNILPRLEILDINWNPSNPKRTDNITVIAEIRNNGEDISNAVFPISLAMDGNGMIDLYEISSKDEKGILVTPPSSYLYDTQYYYSEEGSSWWEGEWWRDSSAGGISSGGKGTNYPLSIKKGGVLKITGDPFKLAPGKHEVILVLGDETSKGYKVFKKTLEVTSDCQRIELDMQAEKDTYKAGDLLEYTTTAKGCDGTVFFENRKSRMRLPEGKTGLLNIEIRISSRLYKETASKVLKINVI